MYTYDLCDGKGERTLEVSDKISTLAKELPNITIDSLTSTKKEIAYEYTIIDEDGVGMDVSVYLVGANGTFEDETYSGGFANLWSDNDYTLIVTYSYDLNDGLGGRTLYVTDSIRTVAMESPVIEIVFMGSGTAELEFCILYGDADGIGYITNVGLYNGDLLVSSTESTYTGEITYKNLSSYTLYTVVVSYEYDLNDGGGIRKDTSQLAWYTDPVIEFTSIDHINSGGVMEGDVIVIQVDVYNPSNVVFTSVVVNDIEYEISKISTYTQLYVEITNDGQFAGGDTTLTITKITGMLGGEIYSIKIEEKNSTSIFINGELVVSSVSAIRYVDGEEEDAEYAFKSDQIYIKIELENSTGYDIYGISLVEHYYSSHDISISSNYEYEKENIIVSDDKQNVYIPITINHVGWINWGLTNLEYGNESTGEKDKATNLSTNRYVRLSSDNITEIYTPEQLMNLNADSYEYYKLMCDMDLSSYEWINIGNSMYGVFDGNGHTISNMGAVSTYENTHLNLGLFSKLDGVVKDLNIVDAMYIITLNSTDGGSYAYYAGVLAASTGHYVNIKNCTFISSFQITDNSEGRVDIGAIVGYGGPTTCYLDNVYTEINAAIKCNSNFTYVGYFGCVLNLHVNESCSCYGKLIDEDSGIEYIATGDCLYSLDNGEYTIVKDFGP